VAELETINPRTLKDALIGVARPDVVPIAGGTDLLVKLYDCFDNPRPRFLVLDKVKPLHKISVNKDKITIGPLMTFAEIEQSSQLKKYAPQLVEAASIAGSVQIRNRATIGGNIANGSPAGDLIPPLYVLEAELELSSAKGKRRVAIDKFFRGPGLTVLKKNELITAIRFKKSFNDGFFMRLATRKALAISKVSVAANVSLKNGKVDDIRIALGAVAPTVIRAGETEEYLKGKKLSDDVINTAVEIIKREARPIDDLRSIGEYRREMVGILLKRGLESFAKRK
jgi:CO/xanthine dehydrogenase FAD-binding subunit